MDLPINYNEASPATRRDAREEYVRIQGGLCHYCKAPLSGSPPKKVLRMPVDKGYFPASFFNWPVHLHHDHETGMTIGAVHCYCNAVLWEHHGE